ncbi:MAG TPA: PhnD/SsuA/transferrin family substrate-binding protein [Rudaea sp.]|jgi:ABC-type phosphate/phosphonate transport system substrate-binding protein
MRISCRTWLIAAALAACQSGPFAAAYAAEYTFAVEPSYRPERASEIYKPLIDYLNKSTGEQFKLVVSRNYHFYWRDIHTTTKTDFAFDEAHIADYRIVHDSYVPLVRAAEPTSYTLVTSDPDVGGKGLQGLVGHSIITMPSPSLGYVLLLELYSNPVSQPDIRSTAGAWHDAIDSVFGGDDDAAIIPTWLKSQYPNLVTVKTTRQFAGPCVSAAAQVPDDVKQEVRDALLRLDTDEVTAKVLIELGVSKFVGATAKDYAGNEKLLKSYIGY